MCTEHVSSAVWRGGKIPKSADIIAFASALHTYSWLACQSRRGWSQLRAFAVSRFPLAFTNAPWVCDVFWVLGRQRLQLLKIK